MGENSFPLPTLYFHSMPISYGQCPLLPGVFPASFLWPLTYASFMWYLGINTSTIHVHSFPTRPLPIGFSMKIAGVNELLYTIEMDATFSSVSNE